MKRSILGIFSILLMSGGIFYFFSCEEVGPYIDMEPEIIDSTLFDTTYVSSNIETPQTKNVLIEEFTGVQCSNCPAAAVKLHEIQNNYPGRVTAIAIHPYDFNLAEPFQGRVDFRTNDGTLIYHMLDGASLPSGGIDRTLFQGETDILIHYSKWSDYVDSLLGYSTPLNLDLKATYKGDSSDYAKIRVKVHYTSAVNDIHYLTVALVESDIVDWQSYPLGVVDTAYQHNHVLRDILTFYNGDELMENPEQGRTFIKEFKVRIKSSWVAENCTFVAFVHRRDLVNTEYDVVHSAEVDIN